MYSVDRNGNLFSYHSKRILNCTISRNGYKTFVYCDGLGKQSRVYVHRLVALNFVPLPPEFGGDYSKATIDHIDGNKLNNHYTNLEWVTREENTSRAWENGLCDDKLRPITVLNKDTKKTTDYPSIAEASRALNIAVDSFRTYLYSNRPGYIANKYICGYQDDSEFTSKLSNIDEMINFADANTWRIRPIIVVDKDTREIMNFPSIHEAGKKLGIDDRLIGEYLRQNKNNYVVEKYICGYKDDSDFVNRLSDVEEMIRTADINKGKRSVICTDTYNNVPTEYFSIADCAKQIGVCASTIRNNLCKNSTSLIHKRWRIQYKWK